MELDIKSMLEQVKKFGAEMEESQSKLDAIVSTGAAGGDMVIATVNGLNRVLEVKIADELFKSADKKMLEDLIVAAINDAVNNSQENVKKELGKIASGFKGIPGFPDLV